VEVTDEMVKDAQRYKWLRENGNSFFNCLHYRGVFEVFDKEVDDAMRAALEAVLSEKSHE
jgi:hypothetical protein